MDLNKLEDFRRRFGKRADKTLEILGKLDKELFVIFETDIGRSIMDEDIKRFDALLYEAATRELSIEERAEFKYLLNRLSSIKKKVNQYIEELTKLGE